MVQSKLKANTCSRNDAKENVYEEVTIGFGFTSYWLSKWPECYKPITKRRNAKPKQRQIAFETKVKITLKVSKLLQLVLKNSRHQINQSKFFRLHLLRVLIVVVRKYMIALDLVLFVKLN